MRKLLSANFGPYSGEPFNKLFPIVTIVQRLEQVKENDALILWGGEDISPSLYGEKPNAFTDGGTVPSSRDLFEYRLIREAVAQGKPIIGICRGAQLLCVYDGGKLAQDIGGHSAGHEIVTSGGIVMYAKANHHQMMLPREENRVLATTVRQLHPGFYLGENDTINTLPPNMLEPEVVHFTDINALGIQPHPEWHVSTDKFVEYCLNTIEDLLLTAKV